jgi:hypothetical protein
MPRRIRGVGERRHRSVRLRAPEQRGERGLPAALEGDTSAQYDEEIAVAPLVAPRADAIRVAGLAV